jgi:hypothetical protein
VGNASPAELQAVLAQAAQRRADTNLLFQPSGSPFLTDPDQLRFYRPFCRLRPPPPVRPVSREIVADPIPEYPPAIAEAPRAAADDVRLSELKRGVSVQLDIAVERRRFFWWRLALSLVARRLR